MKTIEGFPKKITIYNTKGKEIRNFYDARKFDYSDLEKGLYVVIIDFGKNKLERKIFIKK